MKLSEARKRYIGKKFRVKHAERGWYYPYVIEDVTGVCTHIQAQAYGLDGQTKYFFRFRIDIPNIGDKWFSAREIEPVEEQ